MRKVKQLKSLDCKVCGTEVKNVGETATAVTCWQCVAKSLRGEVSCSGSLAEREDAEK